MKNDKFDDLDDDEAVRKFEEFILPLDSKPTDHAFLRDDPETDLPPRRTPERRVAPKDQTCAPFGDYYPILGAFENIVICLIREGLYYNLKEIDPREYEGVATRLRKLQPRARPDRGELLRWIMNPIYIPPESVQQRRPIIQLTPPPGKMVPDASRELLGDTRFFPTHRSIYFPWLAMPNMYYVFHPLYYYTPRVNIGTDYYPEYTAAYFCSIILRQGFYGAHVREKRMMWQEKKETIFRAGILTAPQPALYIDIYTTYGTEFKKSGRTIFSTRLYDFSDALLECMLNLRNGDIRNYNFREVSINKSHLEQYAREKQDIPDIEFARYTETQGLTIKGFDFMTEFKCPYCTSDLQSGYPLSKFSYIKCPICGEQLNWRCPFCGEVLKPTEPQQCTYCARLVWDWYLQEYLDDQAHSLSRYGKFKAPPRAEPARLKNTNTEDL